MSYLEEATRIWREFVPQSGQADTVQGELLRAVEKLRDEATRNGNGNWDGGFEILLDYLTAKLPDHAVFSALEVDQIHSRLGRLGEFNNPYLEDDLYDFLADRVVDYFNHYGSQPHARNPKLLR